MRTSFKLSIKLMVHLTTPQMKKVALANVLTIKLGKRLMKKWPVNVNSDSAKW